MISKILDYLRSEYSSKVYRALRDFEKAKHLGLKSIMDNNYSEEIRLLLNNSCLVPCTTTTPGFSLKDLIDGKPVEREPPITIDHYVWTGKGAKRLRLLKRLRFLFE